MRIVVAAMLTLAAVPAYAQHEQAAVPAASPANVAADANWKERLERLDKAIDQMKAKQGETALAGYSALIADYERLYAAEKRTLYCADSDGEARAYVPGITTADKATFVEKFWCTALWGKAFALVDLQRVNEAIPHLTRAVAMAPERAQYLAELGYVYQALKDFRTSLDLYTRAVDAAPLAPDPDFQLGRALRGVGFDLIELGRWDEAEAAFRRALSINPNDEKSKGELEYIAKNKPKRS